MNENKQAKPRPDAMAAMFNEVAAKAGKTTIMQASSDGGFLVWATPHEMNPMAALLSAALSIMVKRGDAGDVQQGVSIRKVMGVVAPGCDYFWKVMTPDGDEVASGYTATENEAALAMLPHLTSL